MLSEKLTELGACRDAVEWSQQYGDDFQRAWDDCRRGDWMLWLLGKLSGPRESDMRKKLVLACCEVSRTALPILEAYANGVGGVTLANVRIAAYSAADAAYAAAHAMLRSGNVALAYIARDIAGEIMREMRK